MDRVQESLVIRSAKQDDVPAIYALICELATFELAAHEVNTTIESMLEDGFGANPIYQSYVAELDGVVVAAAVFHFKYSTWKGRSLYLDDIIVTELHRNKGVGKKLFEQVINFAKSLRCKRMYWQVLNWNTPAIEFYKRYMVAMDDTWINCAIDL
jgi:GNAT superfamily N-acetyltransferase